MAGTISGVFPDRAAAERILTSLTLAGFTAQVLPAAPGTSEDGQGNVLVSVDAQGRDNEVQQLLFSFGASRVDPPADAIPLDTNGTIGGVAPSAVTDALPHADAGDTPIGGIAPSAVSSAETPADAGDTPIGGVAPSAVTDALPHADAGDTPIGGIAPSAVSSAETPAMATSADAATPRDGDDQLVRRTPSTPADSTIVSPGMEIPYTERQAQGGDTSERRPITDEDIISEARRQREHDQSADLDVVPEASEQNDSPRADH